MEGGQATMLATLCAPQASHRRAVTSVVDVEYSCTDADAHSVVGKLLEQVDRVVDVGRQRTHNNSEQAKFNNRKDKSLQRGD